MYMCILLFEVLYVIIASMFYTWISLLYKMVIIAPSVFIIIEPGYYFFLSRTR